MWGIWDWQNVKNRRDRIILKNFFAINNIDLKAIVTAGPTREYIDPVRYITNEFSGKQGFEIAKT